MPRPAPRWRWSHTLIRTRAERAPADRPDRPDLPPGRPWLARLNAEQRAVATARDQYLLVEAAAGTGKTSTLLARVADLLTDGLAPERLLLTSYTNRACDELKARATELAP